MLLRRIYSAFLLEMIKSFKRYPVPFKTFTKVQSQVLEEVLLTWIFQALKLKCIFDQIIYSTQPIHHNSHVPTLLFPRDVMTLARTRNSTQIQCLLERGSKIKLYIYYSK